MFFLNVQVHAKQLEKFTLLRTLVFNTLESRRDGNSF